MEAFFKKASVGAKTPTDPNASGALQTQLIEMQQREKKLREACEKAELEKALLQNLVNKVYNSDSDDEDAVSSVKQFASELVATNVDLSSQLASMKSENDEMRAALVLSQKRIEAYEAALQNATQELRSADAALKQESVTTAAFKEDELQRLKSQLAEREATIEQLMDRCSKRDIEHHKTVQDLELILQKSIERHNSSIEELSLQTERLHTANVRLRELESATVLQDSVSSEHVVAMIDVASGLFGFFLDQVSSWMGEKHRVVSEYQSLVFDGMHDELTERLRVNQLAYVSQCAQLEGRVELKEARIVEARAFLQQSEERRLAAEAEAATCVDSLAQLQNVVQEKETELVALQNNAAVMESTISQLKVDLDSVSAVLAAEQKQAQLKARQSSQMIRDLKDQIASGAPAPPSSSGCGSADIDLLMSRLAESQEKVWLLESAKASYEQEIDRLSKELQNKSLIITTHFQEAAARFAKQQGKLGASLFRRPDAEVDAQMQAMLQESLITNLRSQTQVQELTAQLEQAKRRLELAVSAGFYVSDEELDEETDMFS